MAPTAPACSWRRALEPGESELTQCDSLTTDAEEKARPLPWCISGTSHVFWVLDTFLSSAPPRSLPMGNTAHHEAPVMSGMQGRQVTMISSSKRAPGEGAIQDKDVGCDEH